jgi:5-methylcytosine-specific restriction endonuclease McrA
MRTNESSGWEWARIAKAKLAQNRRDNDGRCEAQRDGCLGVAEEVHHVVARVDGGGDNGKLLALCSVCHTRFTTETVQERARLRAAAKKEAKRKNHPGRKDRHV